MPPPPSWSWRWWRPRAEARAVRADPGHPDAHALQRPARADHRRADRGLHQGRPASRCGWTATTRTTSPPDRARGQSLAGRRLLHRELQLAPAARRPRACWPRSTSSTLANVPTADSATNGEWVGRLGPHQRAWSTTRARSSASQLPTSVLDLADPQWKGKIEIAPSETDFWPIVSSVARAKGQAAALAWLKGLKANAGNSDAVPDNETLTSDVSQGTTDLGHHQPLLLLPAGGRDREGRRSHAKIAYFAPHDPGYLEDISGAAILKSSTHQAAAAEVPGLHDQRGRPGGPGRTARASSTPSTPAWPPTPSSPRSTSCSRRRSRPPSSAPGSTPRRSCKKPGSSERRPCRDRAPRAGHARSDGAATGGAAAPGRGQVTVARQRRHRPGPVAAPRAPRARRPGGGVERDPPRPVPAALAVPAATHGVPLGPGRGVRGAVIGVATAWCTERARSPGRRVWTVLLVLPVAIPDFVVGYAWHSIDPTINGLMRRHAGDDARDLPARLPAGRRRPAPHRPRHGGHRPQPGCRPGCARSCGSPSRSSAPPCSGGACSWS